MSSTSIPLLPVPPLKQTLSKYLTSVEPLLTGGELKQTRKVVEEFGENEGPRLHERLLAYKRTKDATGSESWLSEIWLKYAYLIWRMPSYVNVNWAMMCNDHPAADATHDVDPVARAAFVIHRFVLSRKELVDGVWPPQEYKSKTSKQPMCMDQFRKIFSTTRIPYAECDRVRYVDAKQSLHIVVLRNDNYFALQVCDATTLAPYSVERIYQQLLLLHDDVSSLRRGHAIGLHTAAHRDDATTFRELLVRDARNAHSLDVIETSMFLVSFDNTAPQTLDEITALTHHNINGRNRWFDKAISLVFYANGRVGMNGEHSPQDAPQPGVILQRALLAESANEYYQLLAR